MDCRTSDSIWRGGERINRPINASSNICYRGDRLSWTTKKADVSNDRDNDLSTPRSLSSVREETPTPFSLPPSSCFSRDLCCLSEEAKSKV